MTGQRNQLRIVSAASALTTGRVKGHSTVPTELGTMKIYLKFKICHGPARPLLNGRWNNVLFLSLRELQTRITLTFSWQSSWWWKCLSGINLPIKVTEVILQDFIHWYNLQSHKKSNEKESIHSLALFPNISSFEDEAKNSLFLICN